MLLGAIPPLMLKTDANPLGTPIKAFDAIRAGVAGDRSQFCRDLSEPFYGANRPGSTVSQGLRDSFWLWSMQVGLKGAYDRIKAFSDSSDPEPQERGCCLPAPHFGVRCRLLGSWGAQHHHPAAPPRL